MQIKQNNLSIQVIQEDNPQVIHLRRPVNNFFLKKAETQTLELIKELFRNKGKWNEANQYNLKRFFIFFKKMDQIWQVKTNFYIDFSSDAINNKSYNGGGSYHPELNMLVLNTPSLMTALHEWKHRIQFAYPKYTITEQSIIDIGSLIEPDAIIWSHTMFKLSLPELYEKNISKGKFLQIPNTMYPLKIFDETTKNLIFKKQSEEGINISTPLGEILYQIKIKRNNNENKRLNNEVRISRL